MSKRESFPLRIDPAIMAALKKWAADDLRSINGQLEYLLREALRAANRLPGPSSKSRPSSNKGGSSSE